MAITSRILAVSCALVAQGCFLETSGIDDPAEMDSGAVDSGPPRDGGAPPDGGARDGGASRRDAGSDAGAIRCETRAIVGCSASHPEISACETLYDGLELVPRCPSTGSFVRVSCRGDTGSSYCDTSPSCSQSPPDGCVDEFWIRFDLGSPMPVDQVRFMAGWWADRPNLYEIWYSDSPTDLPDAGATRAFSGMAAPNPWACETGAPCSDEVPDGCCPDGRSNPQVTDQRSYSPSCNLGTTFPKLDIAEFSAASGRYWYLLVRSGRFDDRVYLHEVELRHGAPCR